MEKKSPAQELAKISDFFISSSEGEETPAAQLSEFQEIYSGHVADEPEVEETVSVCKTIAYPETENAQESMKRCLLKYLEDDYVICRVELKKTADILQLRSRKKTEEEILIVLKDPPSR